MSALFAALLLLSCDMASAQTPKDTEDVFTDKPCPAFLTFLNVAYVAGVTVELPCHCKPEEVQSVVWFFRKHRASSRETKALTDRHGNELLDTDEILHSSDLRSRFSIRLFGLLLYRTESADSGLYVCGSAHKDYFYGYDLDIQEVQSLKFNSRAVQGTAEKKSPAVEDGKHDLRSEFRVFTEFQAWSKCDRCGVEGEQVRAGLCYIQSQHLHVRFRRANQSVLSCGSGGIPRGFDNEEQSKAATVMEVQSCQEACPVPPKRKSRRFFIGESRSQSAKIEVFHLNHPDNHILTIACPKALPNMAVAWDHGSTPIYRFAHSDSGGKNRTVSPRLRIDLGHHLVFEPTKIEDSGVYHCWRQGRRAAEIHLLVYDDLSQERSVYLHSDFPAAVRAILVSYTVMTAVFVLFLISRTALRLRERNANTSVN